MKLKMNVVPNGNHGTDGDDAGKQEDHSWEPIQTFLVDTSENRNVDYACNLQGHLQEGQGGA